MPDAAPWRIYRLSFWWGFSANYRFWWEEIPPVLLSGTSETRTKGALIDSTNAEMLVIQPSREKTPVQQICCYSTFWKKQTNKQTKNFLYKAETSDGSHERHHLWLGARREAAGGKGGGSFQKDQKQCSRICQAVWSCTCDGPVSRHLHLCWFFF